MKSKCYFKRDTYKKMMAHGFNGSHLRVVLDDV